MPVPLDPRLIRDLDCDLRVVMTLDTDEDGAVLSVRQPDDEWVNVDAYASKTGGDGIDGSNGHSPQEYCLRRNYRRAAYRLRVRA